MSAPAVWAPDPVVVQGSTFDETLTYFAPDGLTPVNVTGWWALSTWRVNLDDTATLAVLTDQAQANVGQVVLGGAAGTVEIIVDAKVTATWPIGIVHFDLWLMHGSSGDPFVDPLVVGRCKVLQSASSPHG